MSEEHVAQSVPLVVFEPDPARQLEQLTPPGVSIYCPGEHAAHSVDGSLSESLFPGSQLAHDVDGVLWFVHDPSAQRKHDVAKAWSL